MKLKLKILVLLFIFTFSFIFISHAQYAGLVGKWVRINAPAYFRYIGAALDEETCDKMIALLRYRQEKGFNFKKIFESFKIMKIKNRTAALVRDVRVFEGKAKVTLLSGLYKGATAWIPIEWLDGNKEFISITSTRY